MKKLSEIAFEETSYSVSLLHKALRVLGFEVKVEETSKRFAGSDTRDKIHQVRSLAGVVEPGDALVGPSTQAAIGQQLAKGGLTDSDRRFTVSGTVRRSDGKVGRSQPLLAVDLDLRGVAIYRDAKNLAELERSGGIEPLGHVSSDQRGGYEITFYDWQYRRAERKKADVVVFAIDAKSGAILGRSRLVMVSDYSETGAVSNLDVLVEINESGTEYDRLLTAVKPFLDESKVTLGEVAKSAEQLRFIASELDLDPDHVNVLGAAASGTADVEIQYGLGRQGIAPNLSVIAQKPEAELRAAIARSVEQAIISAPDEQALAKFLTAVRVAAADHTLEQKAPSGATVDSYLATALPERAQRSAFVRAVQSYEGNDYRAFWSDHLASQPEFANKPELVKSLLLTESLSSLTGAHAPMIAELRKNTAVKSAADLVELDDAAWAAAISKAGVPDWVPGTTDSEKAANYGAQLKATVDAAFPTQRIRKLVGDASLPIAPNIAKSITAFIGKNEAFDISQSRISDFDKQIGEIAGNDRAEVKSQLLTLQRVFQVSPTPQAMIGIAQEGLTSAYSIANIPRGSFIQTYADAVGGPEVAFAMHERASHIASRSELTATTILDYTRKHTPDYVLGKAEHADIEKAIQSAVPNYTELFGSPDLCECGECRSVYSAASYMIDLLRFLWRGTPNHNGKTPLDIFAARRPDILHLPLTCENTNTIIPYIDLANEVMERYASHDSLTGFEGYDTGETTSEELRASPQNFDLEAYRKLVNAKYPFTLPYHQPLDTIRIYSAHLAVSRYDAMRAVNPTPDATTAAAIAAEAVAASQEERRIIAGASFDGTADATAVHAYYGYATAGDLEDLSAVRELMARSGVSYPDLVELVETKFINPDQSTLDLLSRMLRNTTVAAATIYTKLSQVAAGTLDPATDADLTAMLAAYNAAEGASITSAQFATWLSTNITPFKNVVTLYEPDSKCSLDTTKLRTIASIYESLTTSGLTPERWGRIGRFVRLWRKLGWTIHETDLVLDALGDTNLTAGTFSHLEWLTALKTATHLSLDQLAVLWGQIDTRGDKSLYRKLFLSRAAQQIDPAFEPDAWGNVLAGSEVLQDHLAAIRAAFRMRDEDITAVLTVASVIDGGTPRALDLATDALDLANLSTIYRYAILAKATKLKVSELCTLIQIYGAVPFSTWDVQAGAFTSIDPKATYDFYRFASSVKQAGFKVPVLDYMLRGNVTAGSKVGLSEDAALGALVAIRAALASIETDQPLVPAAPLTDAILTSKLVLTFDPAIVAQLVTMLSGTANFEATADANLTVTIPEPLSARYSYVKGSGRLVATAVMTDADRTALKALGGINSTFEAAVDALYAAPETFLAENFGGVFSDLAGMRATLLDHPAQATAATLDERLSYIYASYLPLLRAKLRRDATVQHVGAILGLSEPATALLVAPDLDALIADASTEGMTAEYFSDATWSTSALVRVDATIDFAWGSAAADPSVPADGFSVRWTGRLVPPASGVYTLVVDVGGADQSFALYLDDLLVLQKPAASTQTSWEVVVTLNAAKLHRIRLDYAQASGDSMVQLRWKTATSAPAVIAAATLYPSAELTSFTDLATLYHRAAALISGFALGEAEIAHLMAHPADFAAFDFKALTVAHWQRMRDYTALRNALPESQATLIDVFAAAFATNPAPTTTSLREVLRDASGWDDTNLAYIIDTLFGLSPADFQNEIALARLRDLMTISEKTGLSAETIAVWGKADTDFDTLNTTAQLLKNTVKAKYEEADWLEIASGLSDKLREHQQQALIAYLLTRQEIRDWGATDADGLFEYFLIDVQMGACMDTSRIVQSNASIQMFVSRCSINLESDTRTGHERGVAPSAIDRDRWEWMKNYRVWEANRKVFLYPENWLEPDWRQDRSDFFKELESYLIQNDITDRTVEAAFRTYLGSLNEVANLEVCGLYREAAPDGKLAKLHVFGRTHNAPYKFYYRTWDEYEKWSAWQKLGVDIRVIDRGDSSGVHLIPVVWKDRLFLFWPEFVTKQEESSSNSSKSPKDLSDQQMSTMTPREHWEVRLAWSECVDGKWTPKALSKEFVYQTHEWYIPDEASLRFATEIQADNSLTIYFLTETTDPRAWYQEGAFMFSDITSKVEVDSGGFGFAHETWDERYKTNYQNVTASDTLLLDGKTYLKNSSNHRLLLGSPTYNYDPTFDEPFFFKDPYRTYFVKPVTIWVYTYVANPGIYKPRIPDLGRPRIPRLGPPDYIPGGGYTDPAPFFSTGLRANPATSIGVNEAPMARLEGNTQPMMMVRSETRSLDIDRSPDKTAEFREDTATYFNSQIAHAFGGIAGYWGKLGIFLQKTGLEFDTFYHPYSNQFVQNLNQRELPGLMESDTTLPSDNGKTFENTYHPNFTYVLKPSDFATRTYYKENVCFDVKGANSLYNWELFFHAPVYIATRLTANGRFEEAMKWFHYVFDPTTDAKSKVGETPVARYWKFAPFKTTPASSLEDWFRSLGPNTNASTENAIIGEWRDNPFDPHRVAANRPIAYMKYVVIKYVENLIAWGDSLFRQDTMESVNEAIQLYVLASHILGPRPEQVPTRGEVAAETYASLATKWDDFSNALVALENTFPYSSTATVSSSSTGTSLLGVGSALYFCIPPNDKLMESWDLVEDRLYKIRHCQNIDGIERHLALFAPPIDPGALINALAQGLSLGSILADLSSPPPIYRFTYLIQKANEFCADVKALGNALLMALEKKDAEELGRLRASHETQMQELMLGIRERQVLGARANKENFEKLRAIAQTRLGHYIDLLGNESVTVPASPTLDADLTADSQLPPDTVITQVATDVDVALTSTDEAGVKLITKEKKELDNMDTARSWQIAAQATEGVAAIAHIIPTIKANGMPFGVGAGVNWGGTQLGNAITAVGKIFEFIGGFYTHDATVAARMASYIRREQDWTYQANLAIGEIVQLDKQITGADIQIQIAETELANLNQNILNVKAVEQFLLDKFTGFELYQWMKDQLFAVYKQSYNLAYDMAKRAEKAYQLELGIEPTTFVKYGEWDSSKQGLVAGEKLQLSLRQLEKSYLEENRRELELTKSISLAQLDPLALIKLRETGKCQVSLPEELFDLDFRGHYFRRIKALRLSLPCVVGPYTTVGCSVRLVKNTLRINTTLNSEGNYEHENDDGVWIDDDRFRDNRVPVTAIATSTAQNDSGMFEFNFRDERYLPFERAGAISDWEIELSTEEDLRTFDYSTIADVVMHLSYTAREDTGLFKTKATDYVKSFVANSNDRADEPLTSAFRLRYEFPTEWARFLRPATPSADQMLQFTVGKERLPFFVQNRAVEISKMEILARCTQTGDYRAVLSYVDDDGDTVESSEFAMPHNATYGDLNKATLEVDSAGLQLDELDITKPITLKLKHNGAANFHSLGVDPLEVADVFLVIHYKLG